LQAQPSDWEVVCGVLTLSADLIDGTGIDLRDLKDASSLLRDAADEIAGRKLGGLNAGIAALFGLEPSHLLMVAGPDRAEDAAIARLTAYRGRDSRRGMDSSAA